MREIQHKILNRNRLTHASQTIYHLILKLITTNLLRYEPDCYNFVTIALLHNEKGEPQFAFTKT